MSLDSNSAPGEHIPDERHKEILDVVDCQANDEKLWMPNASAHDLQRALRHLHAVIEGELWAKGAFSIKSY